MVDEGLLQRMQRAVRCQPFDGGDMGAFLEHDALQCGYCTPGQLCSAVGLINEGQARTEEEVRELMSGNLCRCGAYPQIVRAVCEVALEPA